jgi:membrane protein DedA with SNARE-associated domain
MNMRLSTAGKLSYVLFVVALATATLVGCVYLYGTGLHWPLYFFASVGSMRFVDDMLGSPIRPRP